METKHSPLPWKVRGGYTPHFIAIYSDKTPIVWQLADKTQDGQEAAPDYETQRANAAFIVKACNSFESMRSSIDKFLNSDIGDDVASIIEEMKAALALANGEGK